MVIELPDAPFGTELIWPYEMERMMSEMVSLVSCMGAWNDDDTNAHHAMQLISALENSNIEGRGYCEAFHEAVEFLEDPDRPAERDVLGWRHEGYLGEVVKYVRWMEENGYGDDIPRIQSEHGWPAADERLREDATVHKNGWCHPLWGCVPECQEEVRGLVEGMYGAPKLGW